MHLHPVMVQPNINHPDEMAMVPFATIAINHVFVSHKKETKVPLDLWVLLVLEV